MSVNTNPDVVVVGAGNAALCAALAAHESGAEVLVLEAAPYEERGGNSRFTGAIFRIAHDGIDSLLPLITEESAEWRDRIDVEQYSVKTYTQDYGEVSRGQNDADLTNIVIGESYDTVKWMAGKGVNFELTIGKLIDPANIEEGQRYLLPGGGAFRALHEGIGLMEDLFAAVEAAGIEVWYDAPMSDLIMDGATCRGVVVQREDEFVEVHGKVILASGGFEANSRMRQQWLGPGWDLVKVRGTRFNQGVGLQAALEAGAKGVGHWGGCHAVPLDAAAPDVGELRLTDKMSRYSYPFSLLINSEGERFVDEGSAHVWLTYAKTGKAIRAQSGAWAFQLFDSKVTHLLEPRYSTGIPVVADTLDELATKLKVPADELKQTVQAFNDACPQGEFDPFGLDGLKAAPDGQPVKSNWSQRIDQAPFTAYPVTCGITFTYGGIQVNEDAEVIDVAGRPMANLYATGEVTGGFFYHNYPAGAGLVRGSVFGRRAGMNAATSLVK